MTELKATEPNWLLLLPCPPSEVSINNLKVAYGPGLIQVLQDASNLSKESDNVILDITICYDESGFKYSAVQGLIALMYRLICVIFTELSIDLQYSNEVDTRVVLFRRTEINRCALPEVHKKGKLPQMASIGIEGLAGCARPWSRICSLESESGEQLLKDFLQTRRQTSLKLDQGLTVQRVPAGLTVIQPSLSTRTESQSSHALHCSVAVGGTFDHLHAGHKLLLTMTGLVMEPSNSSDSTLERCLTIGITGDELLKNKKFVEELEDWYKRQSSVQEFLLGILELISPDHILRRTRTVQGSRDRGREVHDELLSGVKIKYVEIFDPCGPTITDESITSLVLSAESRSGGKFVNDKRQEMGWKVLEVFEVDVLDAEDANGRHTSQTGDGFQGKISSTSIRARLHQKRTGAESKS